MTIGDGIAILGMAYAVATIGVCGLNIIYNIIYMSRNKNIDY